MTRVSIPLTSPDFDGLKTRLKAYLKSQDTLTGYDYDTSVMSVILDLLSYNTHFNAFYLNQVGNELFLSTAVARDSVVKRSQEFGYTPSSAKGAFAIVNIELTSSLVQSFITIPAGTLLSASAAGRAFLFTTREPYRAVNNGAGVYIASSVEIYEGKPFSHTFSVTDNEIKNGVIIPNKNADVSSFKVYVREGADFVLYEEFEDITEVESDTRAYYVREAEGALTNVYFGDGILGRALQLGSAVKVEYAVSSGDSANGVGFFNLQTSFSGVTASRVVTIAAAAGGSKQESIASIKFNAPKFFENQNRAVTPRDYETILRRIYTNLDDVIAWGGDENEPPIYGKVFISVKPANSLFLTFSEKDRIKTLLKKYNIATIKPDIVDPDYIFVKVISTVDYDGNATSLVESQVAELVEQKIFEYNESNLNKFDKTLRGSVLSRVIDSTDLSVISSVTSFMLEKRFFAVAGQKQDVIVNFNNPISVGSVRSSDFVFNGLNNCIFKEGLQGFVDIVQLSSGGELNVVKNIGKIDYVAGTVEVSGILIEDLSQNQLFVDQVTLQKFISISAKPESLDVNVKQKQIVIINDTDITAVRKSNYRR